MAWPGYPDSFDPGWWRVQVITPPIFTGTGTLSTNSTTVNSFSATYQMQAITPLVGQQVNDQTGNSTYIPAGTTITAVNSTASTFTMSAPANTNGTSIPLTVGAEPLTLAEAKQYARIENDDDDNLVTKFIAGARRYVEGPRLGRALMLQSRCMYFMGFPWTGGYYNRLIRSMGPNPWWLPTAQGIIMLAYPPLQQVTSIQYVDPSSGDLLSIPSSQWIFTQNSTPGRVMPQYGVVWPLARPVIDSVQITYTCGYGPFETDIPESLQMAIGMTVATSYENREGDQEARLLRTEVLDNMFDEENYGFYV